MTRIKKVLSVFLALTILLSFSTIFFAGTVSAAEVVRTGNCGGDNLTYTLDSDGLLTIKGTGFVYSGSFKAWRDIKNVVIDGTGVTKIGSKAFMECSSLQTAVLSNGVLGIDDYAFCNCYALNSITIYKTVTTIGISSFFQCAKLSDVYYEGNAEDWDAISISSGNDALKKAKIHFNYDPEHEHNWDAGEVTTAATCIAKGEKTYTCTICGDTKKEEIERGAHKWDGGIVNAGATYTSEGEKLYTCTVCGAIKREPIPKLKAPTVAKVSKPEISQVNTKSITVKWKAAKNATKYQVYRSTDGKKWKKIGETAVAIYTDTGLKAGAKYQYKVRGVHTASKATGKFSDVLKTGTLTGAPTVTLKSAKSKTATASWKKVTGAGKYIVYKSTNNKKWTKVATTAKLSYKLTKLTGGKKIYVKVVAVNAYGISSAASKVKSVTVKK